MSSWGDNSLGGGGPDRFEMMTLSSLPTVAHPRAAGTPTPADRRGPSPDPGLMVREPAGAGARPLSPFPTGWTVEVDSFFPDIAALDTGRSGASPRGASAWRPVSASSVDGRGHMAHLADEHRHAQLLQGLLGPAGGGGSLGPRPLSSSERLRFPMKPEYAAAAPPGPDAAAAGNAASGAASSNGTGGPPSWPAPAAELAGADAAMLGHAPLSRNALLEELLRSRGVPSSSAPNVASSSAVAVAAGVGGIGGAGAGGLDPGTSSDLRDLYRYFGVGGNLVSSSSSSSGGGGGIGGAGRTDSAQALAQLLGGGAADLNSDVRQHYAPFVAQVPDMGRPRSAAASAASATVMARPAVRNGRVAGLATPGTLVPGMPVRQSKSTSSIGSLAVEHAVVGGSQQHLPRSQQKPRGGGGGGKSSDNGSVSGTGDDDGTGGSRIVCEYPGCGKVLRNDYSYQRHYRKHTGLRPHRCTEANCGKEFAEKSTLIRHMRIHTGEKPFQCPLCSQSFADRTNVRRHVKSHTGQRDFRCELCDKMFSRKEYLLKHQLNPKNHQTPVGSGAAPAAAAPVDAGQQPHLPAKGP